MNCLKELRKEANLSQKAMADKLGVSESFYYKIESGEREISRAFLEKVKNAFPAYDMNIFFAELLHDS